jgi:hypothetical protein
VLSSLGTRRRLQKGDCDPGAMACRMLFDGQRAFRGTAFLDMPSEAAFNGALEAHQQAFEAADGSKRPCNVRPVKQKQQLAQIAAKPAERAAKMQRLIDARVQEGCARTVLPPLPPPWSCARLTGLGPLPFFPVMTPVLVTEFLRRRHLAGPCRAMQATDADEKVRPFWRQL